MVESYLASNEKKKLRAKKEKLAIEERDRLLEIERDFKKFKELTDLDVWKDCEAHLKEDCYKQLYSRRRWRLVVEILLGY